jgi:hypothetical protein
VINTKNQIAVFDTAPVIQSVKVGVKFDYSLPKTSDPENQPTIIKL